MIALSDFIPSVRAAIPRFQQHPPNARQETCLLAAPDTPLMIVAGPGSGKTTVLVLRALRLVFVDELMPENIVITTFTRKAAGEIRSRLIEWGLALLEYLPQNPPTPMPAGFMQWLDSIDINRFITGTLDSICEDTLTTYRDPGDAPPVLVEGFVGNALLAREGMFPSGALNSQPLGNYLAQFTRDGQAPRNFGETINVCRTVVDRLIQDQVDIAAFSNGTPHTQGRQVVVNSHQAYRAHMAQTNRMDFAGLEEVFLARLTQGRLQRFTAAIRAVLVDEYQDTNPLQEAIYFELVRQTQPAFTVVGDDDQSLYRFRGATVELFCHFASRLGNAVNGLPPASVEHLVENYRSTPEIVVFFNAHISCDPNFAGGRVQPPKPQIVAQLASNQIPVLGMFRPDVQTLAQDLALFLDNVFRGPGHPIPVQGSSIQLTRDTQDGDFGDAVFLSDKVRELTDRYYNQPPRFRLPLLLRQELEQRNVGVFNPRGRAIRDVPQVQQLLGLVLECIDPPVLPSQEGRLESAASLRRHARHYLSAWRASARAFVASNPLPSSLAGFVQAWQTRTNQTSGSAPWPSEWPVLELCYKLITWIPYFQDDPEGQVYLEAVSRCIAQAATVSAYRARVIHAQGVHDDHSVSQVIRDIMIPLAERDVEVDEEIMPHVPRNRLPIMTVHQAKGLEFPLVIVDIASDFRINHHTQRFRRFPEAPSATQYLEDDLAPYCDIGPLRTNRAAIVRAFDDLVRLYYVAYSRPQSALMLVGVDRCLRFNATIRHVATGWDSDGTWTWQTPVSGPTPTTVNNHPLELI